ncbi:MAG: hypothetical protein Q4B54_05070 [Coriobacteriales bacterium]|nr:hypothetical protein [Coriobacteriales bacterium]
MRAQEELLMRLALKRRRKLDNLSDEAFGELELAVRENPQSFIDDPQEQAFFMVAQALARYDEACREEDLYDDEAYLQSRRKRFDVLKRACEQALEIDDACIDAAVLALLSTDEALDDLLGDLLDLEARMLEEQGSVNVPASGDAWADVFLRPRLRLQMNIARTCLNTARYRMARDRCCDLLTKAPLDAMGARFTCSLAMARLEDEEGFLWLDSHESQRGSHGNAWFHLSRAILMYKLSRTAAARRALTGFDRLCVGGAYLLLQPMYVDTYMPERPEFAPGTFQETVLAVHEADPVIADVPDFVNWAYWQPGISDSAHDYCDRNGLEWRDW